MKDCCERPRAVGAQYTGTELAPDDVLVAVDGLNYDAKRDRWNGFDNETYREVIEEHDMLEAKRREAREAELVESANKNFDDEFKDNGKGEH